MNLHRMPMKRIFIDHHWVSELDFNVEVSSADLFIALNVTCFGTLLLVRLVGPAKVQYCRCSLRVGSQIIDHDEDLDPRPSRSWRFGVCPCFDGTLDCLDRSIDRRGFLGCENEQPAT